MGGGGWLDGTCIHELTKGWKMSDVEFLDSPLGGKRAARKAVKRSTMVAGFAGGVAGTLPIPLVDVLVAARVQTKMVYEITALYDLPECERELMNALAFLTSGVADALGRKAAKKATDAAVRLLAKKLATGVLEKFAGPVVGFAISGATAAALTKALGEAWIAVCEYATKHELKKLDAFLESERGKLLLAFLEVFDLQPLLDSVRSAAKTAVEAAPEPAAE